MKNFLTFFVIICCLACDGSTPVAEPDQMIAPKIMEDIYFDLMLMKVIENSNYVAEEYKPYFVDQYILKKHGIDSLKLIQNQTYYAQKPKMMKRIFENLEHRTKLIEDSIDTIIKREKLD